jgi:hypothetical protein
MKIITESINISDMGIVEYRGLFLVRGEMLHLRITMSNYGGSGRGSGSSYFRSALKNANTDSYVWDNEADMQKTIYRDPQAKEKLAKERQFYLDMFNRMEE